MDDCKWIFLKLGQQHNRMKGKNMANLIIVCGPQAVGKMTVAESLRDKLKYNMMMNHDSIEISDKIFGFATPAQKEFNYYIREKAFQLAAKHNVDMIFTYVAAFELQKEIDYLKNLENQFVKSGGKFYFVELSADLETRLERNLTPHRMERKASKRDVKWSRENLLRDAQRHQLNTKDGEILFDNHIKIDNTNLSPDEVADMVIERYHIAANEKDEKEYRYGI